MVFPLYDDNADRQTTPWVNYAIIALNIFVFVVLQQLGSNDQFTYSFSTVPAEILSGHDIVTSARQVIDPITRQVITIPGLGPTPGTVYETLLTSMFMHGGILHIAGNMLYLWIFGDNIEDNFGHLRFLVFYLLCGLIAAFSQIMVDPDSVIPSLGASGAIAGVLGAYLFLLPGNRVRVLVPLFIFFTTLELPAVIVIGF